jgi:hypothetical protein
MNLAVALPIECTRHARRQSALAAQLPRIKRETGLDSSLPCAVVPTGPATTQFRVTIPPQRGPLGGYTPQLAMRSSRRPLGGRGGRGSKPF